MRTISAPSCGQGRPNKFSPAEAGLCFCGYWNFAWANISMEHAPRSAILFNPDFAFYNQGFTQKHPNWLHL